MEFEATSAGPWVTKNGPTQSDSSARRDAIDPFQSESG